jgi:hypothetical protein
MDKIDFFFKKSLMLFLRGLIFLLYSRFLIFSQALDFKHHALTCIVYLSTLSFSSLPNLKKGSFFGLISTFSPVFGFLPVYALYCLT